MRGAGLPGTVHLLVERERVNKQLKNVGNLGDILKHGALVRLAQLMRNRAIKAPLLYFDTHAFLLQAPWNEELSWKRAVNQQLAAYPYYKDYVRLQVERLGRGEPYRCSAGLVIDVIRDIPHRIYLAEKDPQTREQLQEQVRAEMIRGVSVVENARQFSDTPPLGGEDFEYEKEDVALLALVDPFVLDHAEWAEIARVLAGFITPQSYGVIQLFDYHKPDAPQPHWPQPPEGFLGPVATHVQGPFRHAVFATERMVEPVQEAVRMLGWSAQTQTQTQ